MLAHIFVIMNLFIYMCMCVFLILVSGQLTFHQYLHLTCSNIKIGWFLLKMHTVSRSVLRQINLYLWKYNMQVWRKVSRSRLSSTLTKMDVHRKKTPFLYLWKISINIYIFDSITVLLCNSKTFIYKNCISLLQEKKWWRGNSDKSPQQ